MIKFKFKNLKNKENKIIYISSFLIPFALMLLIFIIKGIFPFGKRSFLRTDLYHQYAPFYSELLYKLHNFKSLFYTYNVGLGTNFLSLFSYYLSSPFNILLLIVPEKYVIEFITYFVVIKIALSGFSMSFYLTKKYKTNKFTIIFVSVFYAMSGYIGAYSWNIMWLDCIWIFPLLIYGFEQMYYSDKPFIYIICLSFTILTNYYIAIMICMFLIIYFIFLTILSNIKNVKVIFVKLLKTAIYSIIGIMISAILLVPTIFAFQSTGSNKFSFPKTYVEYFSIIDVISRHLPFVKIENGLEHWPNIYCGIFVFLFIILYFMNKKYKVKEKIAYLVLLLFFIASFSVNILNFWWHVLRYPNSLPARQSFIYIFIILVLVYKALNKLNANNIKQINLSFTIAILSIIILNKTVSNDKTEFFVFYISFVFIILYYILIFKYKTMPRKKNIIFMTALIILSVEAFLNMFITSVSTIKRDDYVKKWDSVKDFIKTLDEYNDDFYRVEMNKRNAKDDGAFFNYPSASIFSSTAYKDGTDFYKLLGCEASMNAYSITGSTPFADSFLSVKYEIYNEKQENEKELNLRFIRQSGDYYLYQHIDTLPLSTVYDKDFIKDYNYKVSNPATMQNNFARTLKIKPMLEKIDISIDGKKATWTTPISGDYYAFVRDSSIEKVVVTYPTTTKTFNHMDRGYFIELGFLEEGSKFEMRNDTNDKDLLVEVFRFNYDNLKSVNEKILENGTMSNIKFNDTYINYMLDAKINGIAMLTIPYDRGWTLYVDGIKTDFDKMFDCFISFDISKGVHNINLRYMPRGFILGLFISVIGIILFISLYIYKNKKNNC